MFVVFGPTQLPIGWVPEALTPGVNWPRREADHSPPSSAEVKNKWKYTSTPLIKKWISIYDVVLSQAQGQLNLLPLTYCAGIYLEYPDSGMIQSAVTAKRTELLFSKFCQSSLSVCLSVCLWHEEYYSAFPSSDVILQ